MLWLGLLAHYFHPLLERQRLENRQIQGQHSLNSELQTSQGSKVIPCHKTSTRVCNNVSSSLCHTLVDMYKKGREERGKEGRRGDRRNKGRLEYTYTDTDF